VRRRNYDHPFVSVGKESRNAGAWELNEKEEFWVLSLCFGDDLLSGQGVFHCAVITGLYVLELVVGVQA